MTQYIADEAHFKEVIARVPKVKEFLWIGTADIKDLYVEERPFLGILANLISKGRAVTGTPARATSVIRRIDQRDLLTSNLTNITVGMNISGSADHPK